MIAVISQMCLSLSTLQLREILHGQQCFSLDEITQAFSVLVGWQNYFIPSQSPSKLRWWWHSDRSFVFHLHFLVEFFFHLCGCNIGDVMVKWMCLSLLWGVTTVGGTVVKIRMSFKSATSDAVVITCMDLPSLYVLEVLAAQLLNSMCRSSFVVAQIL